MKKQAVRLDPHFKVQPGFSASIRNWEVDAAADWDNIDDEALVQHYQDHLEAYCTGCQQLNYIPSISGFRTYLRLLERRRWIKKRLGLADADLAPG